MYCYNCERFLEYRKLEETLVISPRHIKFDDRWFCDERCLHSYIQTRNYRTIAYVSPRH